MKKYKLINTKTKEEHLCDKITIDGFDYYIVDEEPSLYDTLTGCYYIFKKTLYKRELSHHTGCKKVIATNNPNIAIPKVIDEAKELAKQEHAYNHKSVNEISFRLGFEEGYNKSQETHPFSLNDVKEIINLAREQYRDIDNRGFSSNTEGDWSFKYSTEDEIIQKYQEIKVLTIFYE